MTRINELQDLPCFKWISTKTSIKLKKSSKEDNKYDYKIILSVKKVFLFNFVLSFFILKNFVID